MRNSKLNLSLTLNFSYSHCGEASSKYCDYTDKDLYQDLLY